MEGIMAARAEQGISQDVIGRSRNRFLLCRRELAKAKVAIRFWSEELRLITEVLVEKDQKCFDFFDSTLKENGHEIS